MAFLTNPFDTAALSNDSSKGFAALQRKSMEGQHVSVQRDQDGNIVSAAPNPEGGGVENGPQYRAIADAFLERANSGAPGGGFSPDNPYVTNAKQWAQAAAGDAQPGIGGGLGKVALGRAANDAFMYEQARQKMGLPAYGANRVPTGQAAGLASVKRKPQAPMDASVGM